MSKSKSKCKSKGKGTRIGQDTAIGWCTRAALEANGIPATFIRDFVSKYGKTDTRKIGKARQAARYYRISKINAVIEAASAGSDAAEKGVA